MKEAQIKAVEAAKEEAAAAEEGLRAAQARANTEQAAARRGESATYWDQLSTEEKGKKERE